MQAIALDFDGTMIDSERTLFESWQFIFGIFSLKLEIDLWVNKLWTCPVTITPLEYLEALSISKFDKNAVKDLQRKKENELVSSLPLRHGIEDLIKYAEKKNLKTGIVTGSSRNWVDSHLNRLKISDSFEIIISKEDTSKHKPAPDPYLLMADRLRVESEEILVIEDTPAGIQSAKKAGMRCIAYENSITKHLNLKMADMVFAELPEPNRIESLCAQIFMRQPER